MATKLVLLGTGTPNYDSFAQQSAAVIVDDRPYLIDCGDGTLPRIRQAHCEGESAFAPAKLTHLFITHLHPDHTSGLAGFLVNLWVLERTDPVHVYGPAGTRALVAGIMAAYAGGIDLHRNGLAPLDRVPLDVRVHEFTAGEIYSDERLKIEAFTVSHGNVEAYGFRLTTADKTIVHSGDTCPHPNVIEYAQQCDILVHEAYCAASLQGRDPAWITYHSTVHTSGIELGKMAQQIRPRLLILNHQLLWGDFTADDLLAEVRENYAGQVVFGRDLDRFA